jgi:hypothetical protein
MSDAKHGRWVDPLPNSHSDSGYSADSHLPGALPPAADPAESRDLSWVPVRWGLGWSKLDGWPGERANG